LDELPSPIPLNLSSESQILKYDMSSKSRKHEDLIGIDNDFPNRKGWKRNIVD
jgi:hypothetical protein